SRNDPVTHTSSARCLRVVATAMSNTKPRTLGVQGCATDACELLNAVLAQDVLDVGEVFVAALLPTGGLPLALLDCRGTSTGDGLGLAFALLRLAAATTFKPLADEEQQAAQPEHIDTGPTDR